MKLSLFRISRGWNCTRVLMLGAAVVVTGCISIVEVMADDVPPPQGTERRYSGKQGQILVVRVPADESVTHVQGNFLGRTVGFFADPRPEQPKGFVGLLGLDMQDEPGVHELTVTVTKGELITALNYSIVIGKEQFRVERLQLPKDKVDLDSKALARWKAEQKRVRMALALDSEEKLWQPGFVEPVSGRRTGMFGSVRIMNGQARNPHNGEDIGAPLGTDVVATNDGIVRLTVDHIFSGKGIYLDHGLGFYSMYFHLSEVLVKEGETVKSGQTIGKVGATGRATGPHLHWGVKLNGARVNPYALLELPFKEPHQTGTSPKGIDPTSAVGAPEQ